MYRLLRPAVSLVIGVLLASSPVAAHHSLAGEFDSSKPLTVQGVITDVKWGSPHILIYINFTDASGHVSNFGFEGAPPIMMRRAGVEPGLLKIGDHVTINGYRARAASTSYGHAFDVVTADGRRYVIGRKLD
jgi:hypothetical protein